MRRLHALGLVALGVVPATAAAVSVRDPDIGWPPALRRELDLRAVARTPCGDRPVTRRALRIQSRFDRHPALERERPKIFRAGTTNRWGSIWFDACDRDRFEIGVASGGDPEDARRKVRRARRFLRSEHFTSRSYRLVAVRSTYRQLSDAEDALPVEDLVQAGLVSYGIDTRRNTIDIG